MNKYPVLRIRSKICRPDPISSNIKSLMSKLSLPIDDNRHKATFLLWKWVKIFIFITGEKNFKCHLCCPVKFYSEKCKLRWVVQLYCNVLYSVQYTRWSGLYCTSWGGFYRTSCVGLYCTSWGRLYWTSWCRLYCNNVQSEVGCTVQVEVGCTEHAELGCTVFTEVGRTGT